MPFTQQELEDAYKQMQQERMAESDFAKLAAQKLDALLGPPWNTVHGSSNIVSFRFKNQWGNWLNTASRPSPYPDEYELYFSLCQYDNWHGWVAQLGQVCTMQPWGGNYSVGPKGTLDLSNDPDFANANQKVFPVTIEFSDAHACGW